MARRLGTGVPTLRDITERRAFEEKLAKRALEIERLVVVEAGSDEATGSKERLDFRLPDPGVIEDYLSRVIFRCCVKSPALMRYM